MIALHESLVESLVEWTVLALGIAVAAGLLLRVRRPMHWSRGWLPGVALVVIVANAGIAVNAAAAAARSEAAGAWNLWRAPEAWASARDIAASSAPASVAGAAVAGSMSATAGAAMAQRTESAADAVRLGAIAAFACLLVLLMAWLYLNRSLRVLPSAAQRDAGDCGGDCSQCAETDLAASADQHGRKRARGLTMTRLGGG
ncbi:hypothetical protein GJ700_33760 [Duganella sp. FT92W]|uniref:Uncharacterized protein n=1 Tax=Pseudoduganella rivuli TaxID=2666085 RepID=A0A7X2IV66_9BURK|nr:hypothetical protein [Pseudoduganella rivuli]MRV76691.1 hypothetical protein [Pseudoduganella rivuli]